MEFRKGARGKAGILDGVRVRVHIFFSGMGALCHFMDALETQYSTGQFRLESYGYDFRPLYGMYYTEQLVGNLQLISSARLDSSVVILLVDLLDNTL